MSRLSLLLLGERRFMMPILPRRPKAMSAGFFLAVRAKYGDGAVSAAIWNVICLLHAMDARQFLLGVRLASVSGLLYRP